jgi:ATP-dependent protease ClpP protease subunit
MDHTSCPIPTFCRGEARGMAIVIAAHGFRGFRAAAPDCRFSFSTGLPEEQEALSEEVVAILLKDAAKGEMELRRWLETGAEFSAEEALRLGLIDASSPKPLFPRPGD